MRLNFWRMGLASLLLFSAVNVRGEAVYKDLDFLSATPDYGRHFPDISEYQNFGWSLLIRMKEKKEIIVVDLCAVQVLFEQNDGAPLEGRVLIDKSELVFYRIFESSHRNSFYALSEGIVRIQFKDAWVAKDIGDFILSKKEFYDEAGKRIPVKCRSNI